MKFVYVYVLVVIGLSDHYAPDGVIIVMQSVKQHVRKRHICVTQSVVYCRMQASKSLSVRNLFVIKAERGIKFNAANECLYLTCGICLKGKKRLFIFPHVYCYVNEILFRQGNEELLDALRSVYEVSCITLSFVNHTPKKISPQLQTNFFSFQGHG